MEEEILDEDAGMEEEEIAEEEEEEETGAEEGLRASDRPLLRPPSRPPFVELAAA